jgi:hypothetical protein
MHRILLLIAISLLVGLLSTSCESPLSAEGPRIETPLTPAPKVTPQSIETSFNTANGTYEVKGTPVIQVDTTVSPMRFWISMDFEQTDATIEPLIQEFRVSLDSSASDGLIQNLEQGEVRMLMDVGNGDEWFNSDPNTNTASVLIAEHSREEGEPRTVTITVYLIGNQNGFFPGVPQEQVLGTITVVI